MKRDLDFIKQLLVKHKNNKSAVAREISMNRANLNRYLRKMHAAGMVDENYNVSSQEIIDKEIHDKYVSILRENRVLLDEETITCYIIDGDDGSLSIEELEEMYGGFDDMFTSL